MLLCSHVHLASFRFGPDATWPGGKTIANHAKLWMVDDRFFYIGSDKPLWQWSQRAAVSGDGVESCIFRLRSK